MHCLMVQQKNTTRKLLNQNRMFELISKCGLKVLAEYKDGLGWFDLDGYKLKDDIWVSVKEIV